MKKLILILTLICFKSFAEDFSYLKNHNYYFLMDHDTKEILLSRNADTRLAPSSMTKIMTAYVVLDQVKKGAISLDNQCVVSKEAWRKRGSSMFLNQGDLLSLDDLLKGLLAVSGNDASVALAQNVAGSVDNFAAMMNFKAREIGLKDSHFKNPHGLNEDGHYMSLRDLATLISRFYSDFPEFEHYLSIKKFTYANITQPNSNPLIKNNYDGIVGGKTGHTNDGGFGVVASVKRNNRHLIAVVNKARTPRTRAKIIEEVFDYGFKEYKKLTLFTKNQPVTSVNAWMGNKNKVAVIANQEISINVPKNVDLSQIHVEVDYSSPIYAPINKGEKVATLKIQIGDKKTVTYPLFTTENVAKAKFSDKIRQKVSYKLQNIYRRAKNKIIAF
jgi:D-alanyl-D-alanine carboxypeptidase (penicillin-binding protein 5/6)